MITSAELLARAQEKGVAPRANKFNAVRTVTENAAYDSKHEASRIESLFVLEQAGVICNLRVHPIYDLVVGGVHIAKYEADANFLVKKEFVLHTLDGPLTLMPGEFCTVDAKGCKTPAYKMKRRLMKGIHQIEVLEI